MATNFNSSCYVGQQVVAYVPNPHYERTDKSKWNRFQWDVATIEKILKSNGLIIVKYGKYVYRRYEYHQAFHWQIKPFNPNLNYPIPGTFDAAILSNYMRIISTQEICPLLVIFSMFYDENNPSNLHYRICGSIKWKIGKIKNYVPSLSILNKLFSFGVHPFLLQTYHGSHVLNASLKSFNKNDGINYMSMITNNFQSIPFNLVFFAYDQWYKQSYLSLQSILMDNTNDIISVDIIHIICEYCTHNEIYLHLVQHNKINYDATQIYSLLKNTVKQRTNQQESECIEWMQCIINGTTRKDKIFLINIMNMIFEHQWIDWIDFTLFQLLSKAILNWKCASSDYDSVVPKFWCTFVKSSYIQTLRQKKHSSDVNTSLRDQLRVKYRIYSVLKDVFNAAIKHKWNEIECGWQEILSDMDFVCDVVVHQYPKHYGNELIEIIQYIINSKQYNDINVQKLEKLLIFIFMILDVDNNKNKLQNIEQFIDDLYGLIKKQKGYDVIDLYHYDSLQLFIYQDFTVESLQSRLHKWKILQSLMKNLRYFCGQLCFHISLNKNDEWRNKLTFCFC
eukprot:17742_1